MVSESHLIAERVSASVSALFEQRATHAAAIAEIDAKLAAAAKALGIEPAELGASALPRLSPAVASYPLDPNTMGGHMVELLLTADHGYTRPEMRRELEKVEKFRRQIKHNVNAYYNTIGRYIKKGRVVLVDGLLYHPDRAPLPQGEEDAEGTRLPSNVATLFADREGG